MSEKKKTNKINQKIFQDQPHENIHASEDIEVQLDINEFGLLLNKCKRFIPVTHIIQKSVRIIVCQELVTLINAVLVNNDVTSWIRLLAFPYLVLNTTKKNNKTGRNYIRSNLADFKEIGDINNALQKLLKDYGNVQYKKSTKTEDLIVKTANQKVGEGDIRGAIRVLCSNETIAEPTLETKSKLKSKHPDDVEVTETFPLKAELKITQIEDVSEGIKHFPLSSSGGIDGLRPRHLKDLISFTCGESASHLLKAIASLTDLIKAGKISQEMHSIFYGASLIAFDKLM